MNLFGQISEAQEITEKIRKLNTDLELKKKEVVDSLEETKSRLASGVITLELENSLTITVTFFDKLKVPMDSFSPDGYYSLLANCFKNPDINATIAKTENSEQLLANMGGDYKMLWSLKNDAQLASQQRGGNDGQQ